MRILVSIDIKGIFIKLLQLLDIPVVGLHTLLYIFFLVLRVLPETGLDRWCGCWPECRVVSGDETQMSPLQLSLRAQQPMPEIFHGFCLSHFLGSASFCSRLGFQNNDWKLQGELFGIPAPWNAGCSGAKSISRGDRLGAVFKYFTSGAEKSLSCPMKHFWICSRSNPNVSCFTCNL